SSRKRGLQIPTQSIHRLRRTYALQSQRIVVPASQSVAGRHRRLVTRSLTFLCGLLGPVRKKRGTGIGEMNDLRVDLRFHAPLRLYQLPTGVLDADMRQVRMRQGVRAHNV